jgi:hypothetical protein
MRYIVVLFTLMVGACSGAPSHELAQTSDKDPTWQLNPGKWTFNDNELITPAPGKIEPPPGVPLRAPAL